jgi:hypothetical protein
MKVLLCHTSYTQRGGEDRSFEEERDLLVANGCGVVEYVRRNEAMNEMGSLKALATTMWNREAARELAAMVCRSQTWSIAPIRFRCCRPPYAGRRRKRAPRSCRRCGTIAFCAPTPT